MSVYRNIFSNNELLRAHIIQRRKNIIYPHRDVACFAGLKYSESMVNLVKIYGFIFFLAIFVIPAGVFERAKTFFIYP